MTPTSTPSSFSTDPQIVLVGRVDVSVDCYWCRKLLKLSHGQLTLEEIAQQLYLPLKVCQKLAARALERGWADIVLPATALWTMLSRAVTELLGPEGQTLLDRASRMARVTDQQLSPEQYDHLLIALELAATEEQRRLLVPRLDRLRQHLAT